MTTTQDLIAADAARSENADDFDLYEQSETRRAELSTTEYEECSVFEICATHHCDINICTDDGLNCA